MPLDEFNRRINYLRISLTDHCNLRCVYCMPLGDIEYTPREHVLSAAEIEKVVCAAAQVGFNKIRLTGGEPTLRSDLVDIVGRIASVDGVTDLSMTTNAILLPRIAHDLRNAGMQRINIHVDTLHPEGIKRMMRFATVEDVWNGIESAVSAGFEPIKINAVVARNYNEADVVDLARLTLDRAWHVRFIELMPLGGGECAGFSMGRLVTNRETRERIEDALGPLQPMAKHDPADESQNFRAQSAAGIIGFISPVSEPYCDTCNRMRLTADGKLHLCLLHDDEVDLKPALRDRSHELNGAQLRQLILHAVHRKPTGHNLRDGVSTRERSMFQIGG